jgi:ribosome-binding protein aMBF1 (putative translation factor)
MGDTTEGGNMDPQRVIARRFGAWFKKERRAAGLSVSVVARKLEIPEKTVLRWEAGSSLPNWENVARIYSVLQWRPPTELFDATRV